MAERCAAQIASVKLQVYETRKVCQPPAIKRRSTMTRPSAKAADSTARLWWCARNVTKKDMPLNRKSAPLSLQFPLDVEDDWPPVAIESLPFDVTTTGLEALVAPMFIADLSAHDILEVEKDEQGYVRSWRQRKRSDHSTIWLLRIAQTDAIPACLESVRALGCNTSSLEQFGCHSIDVPGTVSINRVDEVLSHLPEDQVAIAYPSMRHLDEG